MRRAAWNLWRDEGAAVAPTIALVLAALIAVGGIAFDYARMAGMETELQNAADQAALAAAGQLDGVDGARARATQAAQQLVENLTLFANDGSGNAVTVPTIVFYSGYDSATGAKGPVASTDEEANYVLVTVGARTANYALTPVVAALSSGPMTASAFAGLASAICNTPPVMMCNPNEPLSNTDPDFPFDGNAMRGIWLHHLSGRRNLLTLDERSQGPGPRSGGLLLRYDRSAGLAGSAQSLSADHRGADHEQLSQYDGPPAGHVPCGQLQRCVRRRAYR